jgi:hypothetical protein
MRKHLFRKAYFNRWFDDKGAFDGLSGSEWKFCIMLFILMDDNTNMVDIDKRLLSGELLGKTRQMVHEYKTKLIKRDIIRREYKNRYMVSPMFVNCVDSKDTQAMGYLMKKWDDLKVV